MLGKPILCPCCKKVPLKLERVVDFSKPLKWFCGSCGARVSEELYRKLEAEMLSRG